MVRATFIDAALLSSVLLASCWQTAARSGQSARRPSHRRRVAASTDSPCGDAGNNQHNSFLWTIERDPPSYFFGTIHVPYDRVWQHVPNNTKEAFLHTQNVYFELDLTDPYTVSALAECQLLPNGGRLSEVLPTQLYLRLQRYLSHLKTQLASSTPTMQRGLYVNYMFNAITGNWQRKRPVWVMLMVNSLSRDYLRAQGTPVLDLYLAQQAARLRKRTGAVERVDEQCLPLNQLDLPQVLFALNQTLWKHEHGGVGMATQSYTTDELIEQYNCGNLKEVMFSVNVSHLPQLANSAVSDEQGYIMGQIDKYFHEELIYRRNERMAVRVAQLLQNHPNQSFFFAFGAGHFLGEKTIQERLRLKGYVIKHTQAGQQISHRKLENHRRNIPPRLPSSHFAKPSMGGDIQHPDVHSRRRHRHRQRQYSGRRQNRVAMTTNASQLRLPQFRDLWVRLEASSFGPDSFFLQEPHDELKSATPTYAMRSQSESVSCVPATSLVGHLATCTLLGLHLYFTHSMYL